MIRRTLPLVFMMLFILPALSCRKKDGESSARFWAEGKRLLDAGQVIESLQYLERAYARDATHEEGLVYLSKAYIQNGNPRKASEVLATYLATHPGEATTWYMLALARYSERKSEAAVESLEEALHQRPRFPEAILLLGTIYEEYEEWAAAIQTYSSIADDLSLGPPLVPVLLRLGRILQKDLRPEDEKKVEQYLLSAFQLTPSEPAVLEAVGGFYLNRKRNREAMKFFKLWVQSDARSGQAHYHAGLASAALGDHAAAVTSFAKAVELDPDRVEIYLAQAESLAALKRSDDLYNCLVAASAAEPANLLVKWRLLPFYIEKGRHQMAETLFSELAAERGTDPEYYRLKTLFHEARGEYRLAYETHMSRLTISGRSDDTFAREAGILARHAGMYDKAVEILTPLAQAFPDDRRLALELGLALWFTGKTAEGLAAVRKLEPDPMARIWLAYLLLQTPHARKEAEHVLSLVQVDAVSTDEKLFYYDVLVQSLRLKKDWAGARAILEKAVPLARNEEERNSLELALEAMRKELAPATPPADDKAPAMTPSVVPTPAQEENHVGHTH